MCPESLRYLDVSRHIWPYLVISRHIPPYPAVSRRIPPASPRSASGLPGAQRARESKKRNLKASKCSKCGALASHGNRQALDKLRTAGAVEKREVSPVASDLRFTLHGVRRGCCLNTSWGLRISSYLRISPVVSPGIPLYPAVSRRVPPRIPRKIPATPGIVLRGA